MAVVETLSYHLCGADTPTSRVGVCEPDMRHEKKDLQRQTDTGRRSGVQGTAVEKAPLPALEGGAGEIFGWMMARN